MTSLSSINAALVDFCDRLDLPSLLVDAIRYSLLSGGKRLRPMMTMMACEAAGGEPDDALHAGMAIELVHCFSLVHDDLPAMDDDDLRRGRPTLHKHADEATAILTGDVMLALAFQCIADSPLEPSVQARLTSELAHASARMIAGQVHDTLGGFSEDVPLTERLARTHCDKTGALFRCACRMGGCVAQADEATLTALTAYGEAVGLMFQIVDDLLDVTQTTEHVGKATSKDCAAGKMTYPALHGIDASQAEIARLQEAAHLALASMGSAVQPLSDLCDQMAIRTR